MLHHDESDRGPCEPCEPGPRRAATLAVVAAILMSACGHGAVLVTDAHGLVTEYVDAAGGQTRYAYDDSGRLSSLKDPDGVVTTYARTPSAPDAVRVSTTHWGGGGRSRRLGLSPPPR